MKIYVCSNLETLADGCLDREPYGVDESIKSAVGDVRKYLEDLGYDTEESSSFQDWHGGKHFRAGDIVGKDMFGYRCGWVCTHHKNPGVHLTNDISFASTMLEEAIRRLGEQQDKECNAE